MNQESCLDREALDKLHKLGGGEFVVEMIGLFFDFGRKKLEEALAAEQAGDLDGIRKAVHPLKSSAGNVGARRVMQLAVRIERLAKDREQDPIPPLMRQLEEAFAEVEAPLQKAQEEMAA